jgi:transglutaminase-like putative cysteine protease
MNINTMNFIVQGLFPKAEILPKVNLVDILYPKSTVNDLSSILVLKNKISELYSPTGKKYGVDYRGYLQQSNPTIKALVSHIVSCSDSNDTKAEKILGWVRENITYVSDEENYGTDEYWALPTTTVQRKAGDCEDGAFLIHSMLLAAGVPYTRIKTYAGLVEAGDNVPLGGHAWTIYKRTKDNQWVDLDWCYLPENVPMNKREPLKKQDEYVDAYWYMDALGTYDEMMRWGINIYT